ncbi:hypothetical protein COW36_05085 [bacterium (Candidatus Blackallbacteria) CG17_big_fil_post_rev_8_21_14_2_50_48_46]|uniref:Response regulatory domain-containing protein n=1 Tax=bacterium (Candidatus Blackallbacteria) CG17_big_fil_post_rev_8_21_14_2_50_48_46 TaxID=2014261 RepID=A0A2M7G9F2_9BACT|nr:MAG: hypothetical protein COW64_03860 [bacterium (Candidatus Blackallbacteria) CG18_big_fil_WC_8_21_14_2_50_49_26]PIW18671.1 MAG: hypothetical protein COW36_05085 [bacterium (Candidatus Blackallbacteria) CG17_big_fil_post_rev_8_21_14_2_50_48_46]PIW46343.1 MAG: hypothetical protein COW20_15595 [bacterium (Candidatus Blackallbacteria) CG13_big_fil_rev_8_21_14_2_50_49_14]
MSAAPKILFVDDDLDFARLIQFGLKRAGYDVSHVPSGQAALKFLNYTKSLPDVILLDIDLKDMTGYEVCEDIQTNQKWSLIPVLFLSGKQSTDSRLKAFQAGAVGYMSKPVQQEELEAQIRKALEVREQWTESFVPEEPEPEEPEPEVSTETLESLPVASESKGFQMQSPSSGSPVNSVPVEQISAGNMPGLVPVGSPMGYHETHLANRLKEEKSSPADFNGFVQHLCDRLEQPFDHSLTPDSLYLKGMQKGFSDTDLAQIIASYTGLGYLPEIHPEQLKLGVLPLPFCRRYHLVPFQTEQNQLAFLMPHPFEIEVSDALRRFRNAPKFISSPRILTQLLEGDLKKAQKKGEMQQPPVEMSELMQEVKSRYNKQQGSPLDVEDDTDEIYLPNVENDAPLVRLVNRLIAEAYEARASDIHIEAWEDCVMVRYRVDGELRDVHRLKPASLIMPMSARIKVMSGLNLAERRLPQDGRIVFKEYMRQGPDFDLRVAVAPMNFGEKIVMRIIDKHKTTLPLDSLGFSQRNLDLYRTLIKSPYGMILHVGPTGSGKSMTLYSALNEINKPEINIQTAEDPIEYTLPRINQLQVHSEIGLTFARALRSYLRQDPDVILIGEIRDQETAHIAIEAALTGHLLLSTLHTNDAASTLTRFIEMGVEPFMISSSILMICAQRLVRTLCMTCREPYKASALELKQLGLPADAHQILHRPGGCEQCQGRGYRGRTGIHELLIPTDSIRTALNTPGMNADDLKKLGVEQGMTTLYWDAMEKVMQGKTTLEEALSKVRPDEFDSRPQWWLEPQPETPVTVQNAKLFAGAEGVNLFD